MKTRPRSQIRSRAAFAVLSLVVLVAGSATLFGFEFAPDGHGHSAEEAHEAQGVEAHGTVEGDDGAGHAHGQSAFREEAAPSEADREGEGGGGELAAAILIGFASGALARSRR